MEQTETLNWLKIILIIIVVIALGVTAINQTMGYVFKNRLLKDPCSVCEEIKEPYSNLINLNKSFDFVKINLSLVSQ